jgi:putative colanic acid biosynthesis acetyltransferase WcaF
LQDLSTTPKFLNTSLSFKAKRFLWWLIDSTLIKFSPKYAYGFRNYWLRLFGAKIGFKAGIKPSTRVLMPWNLILGNWVSFGESVQIMNYAQAMISDHVVISQGVFLCGGTHDYLSPSLPLVPGKILVKSRTWICAEAFIGPNVEINEDCVIAARAVVVKSVSKNSIVGGNPAKYIKKRYE